MRGFCQGVRTPAGRVFGVLLTLLLAWLPCGCASVPQTACNDHAYTANPVEAVQIMPGDDVEINVFGAPELNTVQKVRTDGKISAKLFGDIQAAGRQPVELQKELTTLYESQVQIKAVTVIARSAAAIYVNGAVVRPGAIAYLRPMTALDAIMECGGFDPRAGARRGQVRVIRTETNVVRNITVDLDRVLTEGGTRPLYLRPFDTVYVPGSW